MHGPTNILRCTVPQTSNPQERFVSTHYSVTRVSLEALVRRKIFESYFYCNCACCGYCVVVPIHSEIRPPAGSKPENFEPLGQDSNSDTWILSQSLLRKRPNGGLFWTRWLTVGLHKSRGINWLAQNLLVSVTVPWNRLHQWIFLFCLCQNKPNESKYISWRNKGQI
jgi:hypothetical protein